MEYSLVAPETFVLKLNIHCKGCETKLKRILQSIQGVHSVAIDAKQGHVTITGTIDPPTIIMMLEKYGRKAELLWPPLRPASDGDSVQITEVSIAADQLEDPKMVEQLQQLSGVKELKKVEVTYSKTIKLTFNNGEEKEKNIEDGKDLEAAIDEAVHRPCVASASCCGSHGVLKIQGHHHHGYCQNCATCAVRSTAARGVHDNNCNWPPAACSCMSPVEPAPSWPINYYNNPSAPPVNSVYYPTPPPPPPPPPPQPYSSMFSDENATSCVIV